MYIIITPPIGKTALQQAQDISRELFRISKPVNAADDVTAYLFGWITHPDGRVALQVDLSYQISVHPEKDVTTLANLLNSEVTQQELDALTAYVNANSSFPFGAIVPSTVAVRDNAYMEADGWFENTPV